MKEIEFMEQAITEELLFNSVNRNEGKYLENLISVSELASILDKSVKEVINDGRTRTLIFHHESDDGSILYWKDSVNLYKQNGDGRFSLIKYRRFDF